MLGKAVWPLRQPAARQFLAALTAARPPLGAGTRLHLRFECFSLDAVEEVVGWIEAGQIDLLAFNEHTNDVARDIRRGKLGTYLGRTRGALRMSPNCNNPFLGKRRALN